MTYMCPFCYHQQKERSYCVKCSFDLSSNHYNAVCSKCGIKFISMEELKVHFKICKSPVEEHLQDIFGKCLKCDLNFYSETMFKLHFSEMHANKVQVSDSANVICHLCNVNKKCKKCENNASNKHVNIESHYEQIKKWRCNICSIVFKEYVSYQEHTQKSTCWDKVLRCPRCKLKFANKHTKEKHILDNSCGNEKYTKCYFENCNVRCLRRIQLNQHIKECHGVDLEYEIKKFPSFNDFDLWKDNFGMKTMSFYSIVARTKYQTNGNIIESITYGCSFDTQRAECLKNKLSIRSNKKRKVKFELNKSNICTSRINVKVLPDHQVLARFCAEHNHSLSLEHLKVQKLPKSRRDFLLNAFIMGASVEEVMDLLNTESKDLGIITKEASLPRRFFKEVQRKSLLKHSSENDMQAVRQFVDDLKRVDGVLIYKSGSEVFNVQEELPADVFMLGLQTQQMLQILETHGQIVYIEGIHSLEQYPDYRLFNFLVTEKYTSNVFPVAHFITNSLTPEHLTLLFASMKPRVQHLNVESIVVQSDQHLEVALAFLFNNKTVFINQWDMSCIDQPKKKMRGNDSFEYAVLVDNKVEKDMSAEQLHLITQQTMTAVDDCVLQFHRDLKFKLKRSHSMFILLNELITYFKKRFRSKFDLAPEDHAIPRLLKQMRQKLFEYKVEPQTDETDISLFDENEEEVGDEKMDLNDENEEEDGENMSMVDENEEDETLDREISALVKTESIDENYRDHSEEKSEFELDTSALIKMESIDENYRDHSEEKSEFELDTSDNKEILKEIVANTPAVEDDSIHVLMEYQKSIIQLLEKNPIARPLVIKSVLEETKSLYEQVQACCNEITKL